MKTYYHPNNPKLMMEVGEGFAGWCLLFGPLWYWYKGMTARGFLYVLYSFLTFGLAWVIIPFFAWGQYEQHLTEMGYRIKKDINADETNKKKHYNSSKALLAVAIVIVLLTLLFISGNRDSKTPTQNQAASTNIKDTAPDVKTYLQEIILITEEQEVVVSEAFLGEALDKLGNEEMARRIQEGINKLITLQAKLERLEPPVGYEKSHSYAVKTIQTYIEGARMYKDGVYWSDTTKIRQAYEKRNEGTSYLNLSTELLPKK